MRGCRLAVVEHVSQQSQVPVHGTADGSTDALHHEQPGVRRERVIGPAGDGVRVRGPDQGQGLGDLGHDGQPLRVPSQRGQQRSHRLELGAGLPGPADLREHEAPGDLEHRPRHRRGVQLGQHGEQATDVALLSVQTPLLGRYEHVGVAATGPRAGVGRLG